MASQSYNDLERLYNEYVDRKKRLSGRDIYSPFNPSNLFIRQQRQRCVLRILRKEGLEPIHSKRILEIGCGTGGVLLEYLGYGADHAKLNGIDLLFDDLVEAHSILPHAKFICADGQYLPYPDESFDIGLQFTAFSSVLDDVIRRKMAREMLRVLRKPDGVHQGGVIIWYDFWLNPTNPQTRGIRRREIQNLFGGCDYKFHRITLAPPISRCLVPFSWILCEFLEKLIVFNSHYLVAIHPH